MLRVGVIFSDRRASDPILRDRVEKLDRLTEGPTFQRFRFPADDPVVFLYVNTVQQPAVKFHIANDGSFLVIDGEVYNLDEIAAPDNVQVHDEAKTLFDLYKLHGEDLFKRTDAAASIVVWDSQEERLLIVRDRWGAVPSFFKEENGVLCWASDIPTLLRVVGYKGVNLPALDYFLGTDCSPAPWTLAAGISKLQPAHLLTASRRSSVRIARYWRPTGRPKLCLSPEETTERLDFLLKQSLRRRAKQGEDLALLLSGGVDSKLVAAALRDLGRPFQAYTFRYTEYEGEFNEAGEAEKTARYLDIPFSEIPFEPSNIPNHLDWMVKSYGEPFGHGLHSSMVRRIGSEGAKILLNGAGPDAWHLTSWDRMSLHYSRLPNVVQDLAARSIPYLRRLGSATGPGPLSWVCAKAGRLAHGAEIITWGARRRVSPRFIGSWNPQPYRNGLYLNSDWIAEGRQQADAILEQVRQDFDGESERDRLVFTSRNFFAADGFFHFSHCWSRGTGLQLRTPYMDSDLDAFVMRLPRTGTNKDDLRRLAAKYLGRDMASSPKIGQTVPIEQWFRTTLKEFLIDQLSPSRLEKSGLFNIQAVQTMIDQHLRGTANHAFHLWPMITVLKWQDLASSGEWE
jgi:asparagine synthase (glutamine-hydrolysing)